MLRCSVIGALAVTFLVVALLERAESHFTFFSPKEMREMMERGRAGKKSVDLEPRSEEGQFEEEAIPERSEGVGGAQGKSVEIGVRLSAKQLERMAPALGEILHEMLTETEKAK
ncbi:motilin-like [Conger conger]|uniref:motilin-like n=1 Tax=Conger conger TaxID=82655 RepID=UPI002A5A2020|nr:motilin-like [Conger conger]